MGLLNSALQIGRSALLSYEGALQVVGANISSAGSPDFTRLSPQLDPLQGTPISGELQPGAGVALAAIQRNIDNSLEGRVRLAMGTQASASAQQQTMARLEPLFDDLNGTGLGTQLTQFFNAFDELQNTPEDPAIRDLVVNDGVRVTEGIRSLRTQLSNIGDDVNSRISTVVDNADEIAGDIARLNEEITTSEAGRDGQATSLRDQRDARLRDLGQLFDVSVREQSNGTVNVYIGSEVLVQGNTARRLVAVDEVAGGSMRTSVRFAGTNQQVQVRGGQLEGLLLSRNLDQQTERLDQLAAALIADVNRIHADGQGLVGFTSVTGSSKLSATDVPLDSRQTGLKETPQDGSFFISVVDDLTKTPVAYRINVNLDGTDQGTTLDALVSDINAQVQGVTASVTADGQLRLVADRGSTFTFGYDGQQARQDTSGMLAALGVNTLFTGTDARDIAVNDTVQQQSSLLAASSVFLPGDGTNAGRVAALSTQNSDRLGGLSIPEFYRSMANAVAVQSAAVQNEADAASSVVESLQAQKASISGVNLDEEAISLVKFQRAFQGTARFVQVVDDLITELVALVR